MIVPCYVHLSVDSIPDSGSNAANSDQTTVRFSTLNYPEITSTLHPRASTSPSKCQPSTTAAHHWLHSTSAHFGQWSVCCLTNQLLFLQSLVLQYSKFLGALAVMETRLITSYFWWQNPPLFYLSSWQTRQRWWCSRGCLYSNFINRCTHHYFSIITSVNFLKIQCFNFDKRNFF